jgi:hypothetical protein
MKTFLGLVNDVERESGTVNLHSRTTDVTTPGSGRQEKIIEHVNLAYEEIQLARTDWPWRRLDFQRQLVINQARYSANDLGITSFSRWIPGNEDEDIFTLYDVAIGRADETGIGESDYRGWRQRWDIGVHDAARPIDYAVDNSANLCLGPKPDKQYMLRGSYVRGVHRLINGPDVPILPSDHHGVIVWKALMLLHGHDEGEFALGNAGSHYRTAYRNLVNSMPERIGD